MKGLYAWALACLLLPMGSPGAAHAAREDATQEDMGTAVVQIRSGALRGRLHNGAIRYLGVPYAAPPLGPLRWRAPRDPQPWFGVRDADHFGSACAQSGNFYASNDPHTFERPFGSEDCLYLNVWTPLVHDERRRPVLLFVHGGSGVYGAASLPVYDGGRLARELDAVVVSINYRLGFFGGINLPALHTGDPLDDAGNFGLLDQIKALDWVQDNIAAFGGDADKVTVMGHSAGAISVYALMRSPLASGKFHRAVVLSGIVVNTPTGEAVERTERFMARLLIKDGMIKDEDQLAAGLAGIGDQGLRDYLRAKPMEEIVRVSAGLQAVGGVADGTVIGPWSADPREAFVNAVPVLVGSVEDEATLLVIKRTTRLNVPQFWDLANSGRGDLQRADFFSSWGYLKYRVLVCLVGRVLAGKLEDSVDMLARIGVPVYRYRFGWKDYPRPWRKLLGVFHGLDVPFIFGTFDQGRPGFTRFVWTDANAERREAIHRELVVALKGFIESADPNAYPNASVWPRWDETKAVAVIR